MLGKVFSSANYILLVLNFIFVITGITILTVGLSVQSVYDEYYSLLPDFLLATSLPVFCIVNGVIIFLLAVFGFCVAFTENVTVKAVFLSSMVMMFILPLSACVAGFAIQANIINFVGDKLTTTIWLYGTEFHVTKQWDQVQQHFECCGVANSSDWLIPLDTQHTSGVPMSCCGHIYGSVHTLECTIATAFVSGCADPFGGFLRSQMGTIGTAGLFMVLMQGLVIVGVLRTIRIARGEREKSCDSKVGPYSTAVAGLDLGGKPGGKTLWVATHHT